MGAIDRGHWYRQADGSYRTMDMRFRAGKTRDREHGGECWFLEDLITRKKRLCGSFRRCREDAAGYEDAVFQRPPGDYHVGDRAYTQKGDLVMISAIGKKGQDCRYIYLRGKKQGEEGCTADVSRLYLPSRPH